jgi:hypothetical protein
MSFEAKPRFQFASKNKKQKRAGTKKGQAPKTRQQGPGTQPSKTARRRRDPPKLAMGLL